MRVPVRNKRVAAGIGVAALAAATVALGSGTYAAFTDSETGPGGTLAAGTLSLDLATDPENTATILNESDIYPGKVLPPKTVTIHNGGSLDGLLSVSGTADGHGGQLQDQLTVSYSCVSNKAAHPPVTVADRPLATAFPAAAIPLNSGETVNCNFRFALPHRSDNNLVQGDSVTVASSFTLTQKTP